MTLPEYSITISPASMFLLQKRPRPWMGDLEKPQDTYVLERTRATLRNYRLQRTGDSLHGSPRCRRPPIARRPPEPTRSLGKPARSQRLLLTTGFQQRNWGGEKEGEKSPKPAFQAICQSDFTAGFQFSPSLSQWKQSQTVPVDADGLLGGLLQVPEAHGHRQIHAGRPPARETLLRGGLCRRLSPHASWGTCRGVII